MLRAILTLSSLLTAGSSTWPPLRFWSRSFAKVKLRFLVLVMRMRLLEISPKMSAYFGRPRFSVSFRASSGYLRGK